MFLATTDDENSLYFYCRSGFYFLCNVTMYFWPVFLFYFCAFCISLKHLHLDADVFSVVSCVRVLVKHTVQARI